LAPPVSSIASPLLWTTSPKVLFCFALSPTPGAACPGPSHALLVEAVFQAPREAS